jgi:hypothetical protein
MSHTLLICGHYPLPEAIGVNIRTMNFVRFFRRRGTVDIAYSYLMPGARPGSSLFRNEYQLTHRSSKSFKAQLLHRLITGIPLPIYELATESSGLLSKLIASQGYTYILVRYLYSTAPLLSMAPTYRRRTIVDFDDLLSGPLYDSMYSSATGPVTSRIFKWNRKRLADYERRCLGFGASLFCSAQDRVRLLQGEERPNSVVVPNSHSDPSFATYDFGDGFPNSNTLLYVGALKYKPNAEGLSWFIESIWPSFADAYPAAKLLVVGRSPDREVRRLCASRGDIELHCDVPDVKPYYRQARAAVVPVLAGGGTRIKILEAALAHRPVLSTTPGAAGLEFVPERDLLLFDDAAQLTAQYAVLMRRESYQTLVRNARELVMVRYSAQAFDDALAGALSMLDDTTRHSPQAP